MAFHVGVTGHRDLPEGDHAPLAAAAIALFDSVKDAVLRLHAADRSRAVPLYAPEPPALRCLCGLADGADSLLAEAALAAGWELVAMLPFARAEFEHDFPPGPALDRYRGLLARAALVCEQEGDRDGGGEPYAEIGQQIVAQSDLLLAIWDGLPPRGPGGTGDVVDRAIRRGIPVGVLPTAGAAAVAWHDMPASGVPGLVEATLLPPPDPAGFPEAYLRDAPDTADLPSRAVRGFENVVLLGVDFDQGRPDAPAFDKEWRRFFDPADRLAVEYGARYRAAGLLRYALVLPATLGSFLGFYAAPELQPFGFVLQCLSLGGIVLLSARGGWAAWHQRFIAYRALAEFIRNARLLAPLGAVPEPRGFPVHFARAKDWTAWYGRAVLRDVGPAPGALDAARVAEARALLRAEIDAQLDFLRRRADRFGIIATRLRRIGVALFMAGLATAVLRAVSMLAGAGPQTALLLNEVALVLPAMAPVFLGLLGFGEYGTLATRYRAVAAELEAQRALLDAVAPTRAAVLRGARRVAEVMLEEGADWQLLVKARTVSAY